LDGKIDEGTKSNYFQNLGTICEAKWNWGKKNKVFKPQVSNMYLTKKKKMNRYNVYRLDKRISSAWSK